MSLTPPQSHALERSLDAIERNVRSKIHETMPKLAEETFTELVGIVHDFGDEAAASTQQAFDHALFERCLEELRRVESVRRRIAAGEADLCADCGEAIDHRRLLAYPLATRCLDCQERRERAIAGGATPRP